MKKSVIYIRSRLASKDELLAAHKYFRVIEKRSDIEHGELVIPRYSALPENNELCSDIAKLGGQPINSYREHCYVADVRNWYYDLGDLTPRTWFALDQIPDEGPFVLKGATNSLKHYWNTHMFAKDKREAIDVFMRIAIDTTIGVQPTYVREFVKLNVLAQGLNGLPISEEYRFFVLDGKVVGAGFYWANHVEELGREFDPFKEVPQNFIDDVISRVKEHVNFWVFDVARCADGRWIVIELNDGQQSGLSCVNPDTLYENIKDAVQCRYHQYV